MRASVRELRQNLSKYLERVKAGERFEITEHGRPVALLVPLDYDDDPIARLEARGLIVRRATHTLENLPPPLDPGPGVSVTEALEEQRRERL